MREKTLVKTKKRMDIFDNMLYNINNAWRRFVETNIELCINGAVDIGKEAKHVLQDITGT